MEGRPCSPERRRVAVLSPYFPFPLSHGGAVRIFHLVRELAREFDVELFAFTDGGAPQETATVLEFCARVVLVEKPRYREPRWSSPLPPEVYEFRSPAMRRAIEQERLSFGFDRLQVEYTQLAEYPGDVLVEHDVTFDLFGQIARRERTLSARWDFFRWRRFEQRAVRRYPRASCWWTRPRGAAGCGCARPSMAWPSPRTPKCSMPWPGNCRRGLPKMAGPPFSPPPKTSSPTRCG
jgi:hypothetical protein